MKAFNKSTIREYLEAANIINSGDAFTVSEKKDGESVKVYERKSGRISLLVELYRDDLAKA
jgi:hypothetical protein